MGIRESFEEHPSGDELNIHDIVIEKDDEKPEPLIFDPETEISNSNWQSSVIFWVVSIASGTSLNHSAIC